VRSYTNIKEWNKLPKIKVNDIEMYYEVHGEGEPLVLLHGFTVSSQRWTSIIPDFKEHFQLIIPDMRGHGQSTNPSDTFTHRQSALDHYALLDHLQVDKFKAVGYSSGAMTLIHMATQQPERITDLVLISGTTHYPREWREIVSKEMDKENDEWYDMVSSLHQHGAEQAKRIRLQFYRTKDSYDDMNFTPPYLSTIKASTLIVHGDRDSFFPVYIPVEMYDSIPDSYLWIMPNMDHAGVAEPLPSEGLVNTIFDFLTGKWKT
jgi:pimeloyl-ACP methyl ester carboxylesterase